jgi:hypothetical protein
VRRVRDYAEIKVLGRTLSVEERGMMLRLVALVAIPLALVSLVPSLVAVGFARVESANRAEALQTNRAEITLESCLDQNARHIRTVEVLDDRIAQLPPETRAAAQRSRDSTVLLISALLPRRNCEELVLDLYGFVPE